MYVNGGAGCVELRVELDLRVVPALRLVDGELAQRGLDVVEELGEELLLGARLLHGAVGVVHRGVPLVQEEADADLVRRELLQRLPDRDEVLQRLGHLQPVDVEVSRVQEVVHRLPTPQFHVSPLRALHERLALRHFVRVMRQTQIHAARVHVDPPVADRLENAERHRGALDMPARTARSPRGTPHRLARLARLPQREVVRVALLRREVLFFFGVHVAHHLRN